MSVGKYLHEKYPYARDLTTLIQIICEFKKYQSKYLRAIAFEYTWGVERSPIEKTMGGGRGSR